MKKINMAHLEEAFLLQQYAEDRKIIFENPRERVKENQLRKGQSIPDAIIPELNEWVELTTFSRSERMRSLIGEIRKYPDRFQNMRYIPGYLFGDFRPLEVEAYNAIVRKNSKDYSQFSSLAGLSQNGILLLRFVNIDPFHDIKEYNKLISILSDEIVLFTRGVHQSQFCQIVFGAYVCDRGVWQTKFTVVADKDKMARLRNRNVNEEKILNEIRIRHIQLAEKNSLYSNNRNI